MYHGRFNVKLKQIFDLLLIVSIRLFDKFIIHNTVDCLMFYTVYTTISYRINFTILDILHGKAY